jgi:soluble lytic murein transglycosylase-like protein
LIQRFDGHVAVALSAYNAGASTVPPFWRDLIARGGEALFCEIASNADAQDYARRILGYRQAYRELRPRIR